MKKQAEGPEPSVRRRSIFFAVLLVASTLPLGSCATATATGKCIDSNGTVLNTGNLQHCEAICANPEGCTWKGYR